MFLYRLGYVFVSDKLHSVSVTLCFCCSGVISYISVLLCFYFCFLFVMFQLQWRSEFCLCFNYVTLCFCCSDVISFVSVSVWLHYSKERFCFSYVMFPLQ